MNHAGDSLDGLPVENMENCTCKEHIHKGNNQCQVSIGNGQGGQLYCGCWKERNDILPKEKKLPSEIIKEGCETTSRLLNGITWETDADNQIVHIISFLDKYIGPVEVK